MFCERCRAEIAGRVLVMDPEFFDVEKQSIKTPNGLLHVPDGIWDVLEVLWMRMPHLVTKDSLLSRVYGATDDVPHPKIFCVRVCSLRKMLISTPYFIETVWGKGFRLSDDRKELRIHPQGDGVYYGHKRLSNEAALDAVNRYGSIARAARQLGVSYAMVYTRVRNQYHSQSMH